MRWSVLNAKGSIRPPRTIGLSFFLSISLGLLAISADREFARTPGGPFVAARQLSLHNGAAVDSRAETPDEWRTGLETAGC